jgi:hypothetical protein
MARGRFPQGPTRSRPVVKLHTFGRVCLCGGQKYFSLPSLAAQLLAFLVLLPCTHKWLQRKRSLQAWYRLRLWGYLSAFSRFVSSCCLQQLTNRSGQGRGDCSFQSQTPLAAAPLRGLPARYLCGCRHRSAVPTSTFKYPSGEK